MASIIKFARPRPFIRPPKEQIPPQKELQEARRSLSILIGSFFVTAMVMCAAVVAMVSNTWTDLIIMSAFVLVFALLKIALANALIYTMWRYDAATANVSAETPRARSYRRATPLRPAPATSGRRTGAVATGKLRVAPRQ
jgi:membrane protein YdbS with pleckstrin-like domain